MNTTTQTTLDAAKQYRDAGISFIPLKYVPGDVDASKAPEFDALIAVGSLNDKGKATWHTFKLHKNKPGRLPTDEEARIWFGSQKQRNIAIVLGSVSRGLVAIDFDDTESYRLWAKEHKEIVNKTAIQKTGKGYHVLLRLDNPPKSSKFEYNGTIHDVKGEGGYIVAWPSIHGTGAKYEWLAGHAPWESGILTVNSLADIGIEHDQKPDPVTEPTPALTEAGAILDLKPLMKMKELNDFINARFSKAEARKIIESVSDIVLTESESEPMRTLSIDEVMTTDWPEPVWAIPNLLPAGLTILAGKPKLGKSWLLLQMSQAVATGGTFLNQRLDEPGRVLYLALEDNAQRLKSRIKIQGWNWQGLGIDFVTMDEFKNRMGSFLAGGADALARQLEQQKYHLVMIDTLSRACFNDPNRNELMAATLAPIQEFAMQNNTAVLFVDHHNKSSGILMDAIGDILGGTQKGATLDTAWGLYRERGKQDANLAITGRDVDEQNISLMFDKSTGKWDYQGDYYSLKVTEARQQILDVITDLGGSAQLMEVAQNLGITKQAAHQQLGDLVAASHLTKVNKGRFVFYEIKK